MREQIQLFPADALDPNERRPEGRHGLEYCIFTALFAVIQ
jgi:hypothetical protein